MLQRAPSARNIWRRKARSILPAVAILLAGIRFISFMTGWSAILLNDQLDIEELRRVDPIHIGRNNTSIDQTAQSSSIMIPPLPDLAAVQNVVHGSSILKRENGLVGSSTSIQNSTSAEVSPHPLEKCNATAQIELVVGKSGKLWKVYALDSSGMRKTVGGDEFYIYYFDQSVYKASMQLRKDALDPTAVAYIKNHHNGTYSLECVRPPTDSKTREKRKAMNVFPKQFLFPNLTVANWYPGHMAKGESLLLLPHFTNITHSHTSHTLTHIIHSHTHPILSQTSHTCHIQLLRSAALIQTPHQCCKCIQSW